MRKQRSGEVFRITGARTGLEEDVRGRQRRYIISMTVRTVAVILTAALWNVARPVAIGTLVLGAFLPYIAVVIANAGRENTPGLPTTFVPAPFRPPLEPSSMVPGTDPADEAPTTERDQRAAEQG
ncbi:DUF3099 domain-containing protein [Streptomyces sp. NBC_00440]|uniref:DUF3099 domain-containing protein n=1 Tax=unclassified Streptomyces TaxID=2593676 RepID=UPI002E1C0430|nr:DUF3099 domain-containing protein [Streptomyces sp. NBC_00932]